MAAYIKITDDVWAAPNDGGVIVKLAAMDRPQEELSGLIEQAADVCRDPFVRAHQGGDLLSGLFTLDQLDDLKADPASYRG